MCIPMLEIVDCRACKAPKYRYEIAAGKKVCKACYAKAKRVERASIGNALTPKWRSFKL